MAKAKKTTGQEIKKANTLETTNAKENVVKKVLSVKVDVDKEEKKSQPKPDLKTTPSIKLRPGQVLYMRIDGAGNEVEPQVVKRSTWEKYLSKNPNFKLKKNTI